MFSVVNGVLLKPLPYSDQDRILALATRWADSPDRFNPMSKPDILDLEALPAVQSVVGYTTGSDVLIRDGSATLISVARVTSGILAPFDLQPFMGRDLSLEESSPGSPQVVVVSHGFWQRDLGSDPNVLGSTLELGGEIYEVVGVASEGFDFPERAQIWRPFVTDPEACGRGCHSFNVVGRTSLSTDVALAREQADGLAVRLAQAYPDTNLEKSFHVRSLDEHILGDVRSELWVLLGAVGLVLLVACANVANLLLARAQDRISEMGVRASLGASRRRLTLQMLTESLVLAAMGGGLGLIISYGSVGLLRRVTPGSIPRIDEISVDMNVVSFTLALVFVVALLFGLSPALHLARSSPASALQSSQRGSGRSHSTNRSRRLLLASEMALSVLLLIGAGLLVRTLERIHRIQPGYQVEDVLRFSLVLPSAGYPDLSQVTQFYETLEKRIGALPRVASVGSGFGVPLGRWGSAGTVLVEGRPEPPSGEETGASLRSVTPGYLDAHGIPILRGRGIEPTDNADAPPVALVNQTFIDQNFPGQDPLGEQVRVTVSLGFGSPTWTIVGVVPDIRSGSITRGAPPEVYVPHAQMGAGYMTVVVRSMAGRETPLTEIREIVAELDPAVPLRDVETMEQVMAGETAATRFYLVLLSVFAGLAVVLASVGLYGVIAYLVSTQRQEIGIRMALGAQRVGVVRMILAQAAAPTLFGLAAGLLGALVGARVLEGFLYQVNPRDPLVYACVALLLLGVATASAFLPARQASLVDPGEIMQGN
jgi:predicted permease